MCQETKKPHVHAEAIKAWADGATIQYLTGTGWKDVPENNPSWHDFMKYRIKPEQKKACVILYKDGTVEAYPHEMISYAEKHKDFKKVIGVIEYEDD